MSGAQIRKFLQEEYFSPDLWPASQSLEQVWAVGPVANMKSLLEALEDLGLWTAPCERGEQGHNDSKCYHLSIKVSRVAALAPLPEIRGILTRKMKANRDSHRPKPYRR